MCKKMKELLAVATLKKTLTTEPNLSHKKEWKKREGAAPPIFPHDVFFLDCIISPLSATLLCSWSITALAPRDTDVSSLGLIKSHRILFNAMAKLNGCIRM
jgi:hypothetical protein